MNKTSTPPASIRVFPVFIADCKTCPSKKYSESFKEFFCDAITQGGFSYSADVYMENENGITDSCPYWRQSDAMDTQKKILDGEILHKKSLQKIIKICKASQADLDDSDYHRGWRNASVKIEKSIKKL
jgi:hypothetical protein